MENQMIEGRVLSGGNELDGKEALVGNETAKRKTKRGVIQSGNGSDIEGVRTEGVGDGRTAVIRIVFEGEAASKIQKCESELRDRLSKPDLGKVIGREILSWSEKRWAEIVEENTDVEYFFAQIRKCTDRGKSIKLLKSLAEKLKNENAEGIPHSSENENGIQESASFE